MKAIILDVETRSYLDLSKTNADVYSRHESTDLICIAWKILGASSAPTDYINKKAAPLEYRDIKQVDPSIEFIKLNNNLAGDNLKIVAHNALFEYFIFKNILVPRYGFPAWILEIDRWICTQGLCYTTGLPGKLEEAARFMSCKHQKLETGNYLINQYSKPAKEKKIGRLYFRDWKEGDFEKMLEYNRVDVLATEELFKSLYSLPNTEIERKIWLLDFKQNIEGLHIDRQTMETVQKILNENQIEAENRMKELEINVRSPKQFKEYFERLRIKLPNTQIQTIEKLEEQITDDAPREVIQLRKFLSKSSVKKYNALAARLGDDDILRLSLRYHKAHTGRWGGAGFQPHNLPRMDKKEGDIVHAIEEIKKENIDFNTLIELAKTILPGLIIPKKDFVFLKGDFSQIEARVLALLAGQLDLVEMFRKGAKIYEIMGALIFAIPVKEIHKKHIARQVGKQTVLGCGYGMGAEKFLATCAKYGIDINREIAEKAKSTYRGTYAKIVQFWYDLENAFRTVWQTQGRQSVQIGWYIKVTGTKTYVKVLLPSGRSIYYHRVKVSGGQLSFYSPEKKTRVKIWGGLLTENVIQAVSRDVLVHCMLKCEEAGLNPVLHVHDEIICQVHEQGEFRGFDMFNEIMNTPPEWLADLPLKTEIEKCKRYYK